MTEFNQIMSIEFYNTVEKNYQMLLLQIVFRLRYSIKTNYICTYVCISYLEKSYCLYITNK